MFVDCCQKQQIQTYVIHNYSLTKVHIHTYDISLFAL